MNCRRVRESLHSYLAGDIKGLERLLMEEHIATCNECKSELEDIKKMKTFLKGLHDENERQIPADFDANIFAFDIMEAIDYKKYKKKKQPSYNLRSLGASLICAGIALFILNTGFAASLDRRYESFIGKGINSISDKIMKLDGITARIGYKYNGGM